MPYVFAQRSAFLIFMGSVQPPNVIMRPRGISAPEGRVATTFRSIEDVIKGIRESTYKVQTESRLAHSGLKREQNIAGVLKEYAWLYNLETVRRAGEAYRAETDPENTYGEDWFAHPKAGSFLRDLWAAGESKENEDVARMMGHEPFDTAYLVEQFLDLG
jgi:hypothetical protein